MKFQTKDMDNNLYISMLLFIGGIIDQTTNALIFNEIGITNTISITISTVKLFVVNISVSRYYPTLILNPSHELIKQNNTAWKCRRCCCRRMRGRGGPPMGRGMMRPNFRPGPPWVSAFFLFFLLCPQVSSWLWNCMKVSVCRMPHLRMSVKLFSRWACSCVLSASGISSRSCLLTVSSQA